VSAILEEEEEDEDEWTGVRGCEEYEGDGCMRIEE